MRICLRPADPQVMDTIEDTLFSMGHEHLWVTNQQDARDALGRDHFHYVLLDLQIPAKPNRGGASKEFGINLLREISEHVATPRTPVIIMTAYISECLDMSTRLLSFGASEFYRQAVRQQGTLAGKSNPQGPEGASRSLWFTWGPCRFPVNRIASAVRRRRTGLLSFARRTARREDHHLSRPRPFVAGA